MSSESPPHPSALKALVLRIRFGLDPILSGGLVDKLIQPSEPQFSHLLNGDAIK